MQTDPSTNPLPLRRARGAESVLAVEDDEEVLELAVVALKDLGYTVLTAGNARDALNILRRERDIDILFSDVIMPGGMNGAQLAVEARRIRPGISASDFGIHCRSPDERTRHAGERGSSGKTIST